MSADDFPPAILLPRPTASCKRNGYETAAGRVYPFYGRGGASVMLPEGRNLKPECAREFAAAIVAVADDLMEDVPAADVEALAEVLASSPDVALRYPASLARTILRAGYKPPERAS